MTGDSARVEVSVSEGQKNLANDQTMWSQRMSAVEWRTNNNGHYPIWLPYRNLDDGSELEEKLLEGTIDALNEYLQSSSGIEP